MGRMRATVVSLAGGLDLPVRQTVRGEAAQAETPGNGHGHTARGRHSDGTVLASEASSGTLHAQGVRGFTRALTVDMRIYRRSSVFASRSDRSIHTIFDRRCRRTKWRSARTRWPSPRSRSSPAWRTSWRTRSN